MTGRDLIIYILENNLENEDVFKDGRFLGYLSIDEIALKYKVGIETVKLWFELGFISGIKIGEEIYFPVNFDLKRG